MTLTDITNDICNRKTGSLDNDIRWSDNKFSPYIIQRMVSMTSPLNAYLVNEFSNHIGWYGMETTENTYHNISSFAQRYSGRFKYPKRKKDAIAPPSDELAKQASSLGLSKKEIIEYDMMLSTLSTNPE